MGVCFIWPLDVIWRVLVHKRTILSFVVGLWSVHIERNPGRKSVTRSTISLEQTDNFSPKMQVVLNVFSETFNIWSNSLESPSTYNKNLIEFAWLYHLSIWAVGRASKTNVDSPERYPQDKSIFIIWYAAPQHTLNNCIGIGLPKRFNISCLFPRCTPELKRGEKIA